MKNSNPNTYSYATGTLVAYTTRTPKDDQPDEELKVTWGRIISTTPETCSIHLHGDRHQVINCNLSRVHTWVITDPEELIQYQ